MTSLPTIPPQTGLESTTSLTSASPSRYSPTGWDDLPSDTEEMFFFTPVEREDFRRIKRRRLLEQDREERLRALSARNKDCADDDDQIGRAHV